MAEEPELSEIGEDRRAFIKRLVVAGFVAPTVVSFSTSGIQAAFAQSADSSGAGAEPTNQATTEPTSPTTTTVPPAATTTTVAPPTTTTTVPPTTTTTTPT
jgi:hypothetical protein